MLMQHRYRSFIPPYIQKRLTDAEADDHTALTVDEEIRAARTPNRLRGGTAPATQSPTDDEPCTINRKISRNAPIGLAGIPGVDERLEGQPPSTDDAVNTVYDNIGIIGGFYCEVLERNGIDDAGFPYLCTVHFREFVSETFHNNALWNGTRVVLGDGDEIIFLRNGFAQSLGVLAHEFTHGLVYKTLRLKYEHQAGALNESLCDVIATMIKQRHLGQNVHQADWVLGEDIFTTKVKPGTAVRSLKEPGTAFDEPDLPLGSDAQVGHMRQFVKAADADDDEDGDNGYIHLNSGIPNKAFYNASIALGGFCWERAGKIWYEVMRNKSKYYMRSNSSFSTFADATVAASKELYGHASDETRIVRQAWLDVGVKLT